MLGLGAAIAVLVAAAGFARADDPPGVDGDPTAPLGPGPVTVEIGIEHSRFDPGVIRVVAGTTVRFVVANGDPIRHELIVGPDEVHRRHENGTEASHPQRPGEVTVAPLASAETTYSFDEEGTFEFACHLPGHRAYGMVGIVEVVAA